MKKAFQLIGSLSAASLVFGQDASATLNQKTSGSWSLLADNHVVCIHTIALPNNRIYCAERPHILPYADNAYLTNGFVATEYQVDSAAITSTDAVFNPFCSGHAQMGDGNILYVGGDFPGHTSALTGATTLTDGRLALRTYQTCPQGSPSSCTGTWKMLPNLAIMRWYPTVVTLYTGNNIILSGSLKNLDLNNLADKYYPPKTTTPAWPRTIKVLNDAFPYNLYPVAFSLPTGNVLLFVNNSTALINTDTDIIDDKSILPIILADKQPMTYPYTPSSFMLPLTIANGFTATVMVCGGTKLNLNADERCIALNTGAANPQWAQVASMPLGRVMSDAVVLPNAQVLVLNGAGYGFAGGAAGESYSASNPIYPSFLYNPPTNTWSTLASNAVPRMYHSGAILLADGRVVSTGSEEQSFIDWVNQTPNCYNGGANAKFPACTSPFEMRMEVFEPPYLFLPVQRPVIVMGSVQATVKYATSFSITLATDATKIDAVSFVRYSTSTHSLNTDQRYVELVFTVVDAGTLKITSPTNSKIAPPGNWFLFVSRGGKPSVAATILLSL